MYVCNIILSIMFLKKACLERPSIKSHVSTLYNYLLFWILYASSFAICDLDMIRWSGDLLSHSRTKGLHLSDLISRRLDSNELQCNCSLAWLKRYATVYNLLEISATCAKPEKLQGQNIADVDDKEFNCREFSGSFCCITN